MDNKPTYYTGTVVGIDEENKELWKITVDIPGVIKGVPALPVRNQLDEPKVGDFVLLRCLDDHFGSLYLWEKLKEDTFIGFRAAGKEVNITPDFITVGIYDIETEYTDDVIPEPTTYVKIDKEGNIEIKAGNELGDGKITIIATGDISIETTEGNLTQKVKGNVTQEIEGTTSITCKDVTIESKSDVEIKGGCTVIMDGTVTPGSTGGFCGLPACAFSGAPHAGKEIKTI